MGRQVGTGREPEAREEGTSEACEFGRDCEVLSISFCFWDLTSSLFKPYLN